MKRLIFVRLFSFVIGKQKGKNIYKKRWWMLRKFTRWFTWYRKEKENNKKKKRNNSNSRRKHYCWVFVYVTHIMNHVPIGEKKKKKIIRTMKFNRVSFYWMEKSFFPPLNWNFRNSSYFQLFKFALRFLWLVVPHK